MGVGHRLPQLVGRFDPGDDDSVGADIEHPFDLSDVQVGDADKCRGVAADRGPHMFENIMPVEVAVFGVDDHPVEP